MNIKKQVIGFCHRVAYATTLALAGLLLAVAPAGPKIDPTGFLTMSLDLPVAAVGLLLPMSWRGVDLWFQAQEWGYMQFADGLIQHLRTAIAVYVVLFYLVELAWRGIQRMRHRRDPVAEHATSEQR